MANASPSSASTTTTPSSAWSRLVQLTRTASKGSRAKSTGSSNNASSSVLLSEKGRRAESSSSRPPNRCIAPFSPAPNGAQSMSPQSSSGQIPCRSTSNDDCITACPCRVEDVDCVASQQQEHKTRSGSPRNGRQPPATVGDLDQDATPHRARTEPRPNATQRTPSPAARPGPFETRRNTVFTQLGQQRRPETSVQKTETTNELKSSVPCGLTSLEGDVGTGRTMSEAAQPSTAPKLPTAGMGLHEGSQNSANKTSKPQSISPSPTSIDESIPSSSPPSKSKTRANEAQVDGTKPHKPAPVPKTKRRLTLQSGSYERQASNKKRKTAPKRKDGVQTTLSLAIGSGAGMRECKLCDTVYNPFHPEDVKVHAKRHAVAVKNERKSENMSGLTGSSLVE